MSAFQSEGKEEKGHAKGKKEVKTRNEDIKVVRWDGRCLNRRW